MPRSKISARPPQIPTLLKFLQERGVASRRRLVAAIVAGEITVNGAPTTDTTHLVRPDRDQVIFQGRPVQRPAPPVYLVMNKPRGILTTVRDEHGRRTILDLLPPELRAHRIFPVGRLDLDTEGLLILTNDGDLSQRLTHPSYKVEKEYEVKLDRPAATRDLAEVRSGVRLEDGITAAARITPLDGNRYSLTIREGKKRHIRRLFHALGYEVVSLKRVRIKDLRLGNLPPGSVRRLTKSEVRELGVENRPPARKMAPSPAARGKPIH